jgi:hypothetical protein
MTSLNLAAMCGATLAANAKEIDIDDSLQLQLSAFDGASELVGTEHRQATAVRVSMRAVQQDANFANSMGEL